MDPASLFDKYGPMVYRRALRILGNAADAEEATQEVFIRAFKALADFDPRAQHSTWLYRITTNYCLNQMRNRVRRTELMDQRKAEVPKGSVATDPEKLALMRDLLARADERQAQAALLVFVDGLSHDEAAVVLDVSRRTVGNLCKRFVKWAREQS